MLVESASTAITQRQLRHANASATLGIYAHVIPEDHSEAIEEIQSVLIGTPG
jgi:integrase